MAQTLKQRGLITQSYGVQNAGTPGDLSAVDFGSFTRRPMGPSLAGWTMGWSAHNTTANTRHTWTISAASGEDLIGMVCGWYYFGPSMGNTALTSGNGKMELLRATSSYGGNEVESLILNIDTMNLDVNSVNLLYATTSVKVLPHNQWVWLGLAWERTGSDGANTWIIRVVYKTIGGVAQTLYTTPTFTLNAHHITGAGSATLWQNNAIIPARIGLPSLYQLGSIADAIYPAEIIDPVVGPNIWYVASAAAGGGTGVSTAQAWTAAELLTETAAGCFTILSGNVVDASGAIVTTSSFDADVLAASYKAGTAIHNGDKIYFDDSSGPIRPLATLSLTTCDNCQLLSLPSLGRAVELRGTVRVPTWTLDSGAIWTATVANNYGVVFEFDSLAIANSNTGKARWLAHPIAANIAAYRIAATDGSFWSDGGGGSGTNIYVQATGSGNPNSNGKVYECATGSNLIEITNGGCLVKGLLLRYAADVGTNNTANDNSVGDCIKAQGNGLIVVDGNDMFAGGKHIVAVAESGISTKQRVIYLNNVMNDASPTPYRGAGGQTLTVENGTTDAADNQVYYENNSSTTNAGLVGSTTGIVDINNTVTLQHNNGLSGGVANPICYSKTWFLNNRWPGPHAMGLVSSYLTVKDNVIGYPSIDNSFGGLGTNNGTKLTMTGNRITGRALPAFQLAGSSGSTVIGNIFLLSGTCNAQNWVGTIEFDGNTLYDIGLVSGASNSLFKESGTLNLNFYGNIVKLGTVDIAIFANGIRSQENFGWNYNEYDLPPAAVVARNYNDGSTTSDRTFTQWIALFSNQFDQNSADNANLLLSSSTYRPLVGSPAINAVQLLNVISLKGASDVGGNVRGVTGTSEAGAWLYQTGRDKGLHTTVPSYA